MNASQVVSMVISLLSVVAAGLYFVSVVTSSYVDKSYYAGPAAIVIAGGLVAMALSARQAGGKE